MDQQEGRALLDAILGFQRFDLLLGQLEHEILRKALNITLHLPIELRSYFCYKYK